MPDSALIAELSGADHLPAEALRRAAAEPAAIADETLRLIAAAGDGTELADGEANLLFWGLHALAAARDARAFAPLLRLLRQDADTLEDLLGDAAGTTLPRVLAGLYDGEPDGLFALILDTTVDDLVRNEALAALVFLVRDGRIPLDPVRDLLMRFDDKRVAVEGDIGWIGWEEAIALLGLRALAPRVEAARKDGRLTDEFSDPAWFRPALRRAETRPDDRRDLDERGLGYLDDPVAALAWTAEGAGEPVRNLFRDVGRNDPCPCGSGRKFKKCCLATA
ncbi:DUF1186 domain-containing protein [Methylobacterium planeticum]|uniref:DUF1186 domain-containing protein n=1 Tax=Methylobacterium planeticum TaxID=2615211 RepID=A0A6N6MYH4_9HYPH|nr:DUF1186 domain-containing protein [Methylobacterium planeticum]KAB1076113.1 DUF1186 domain-containing protein [Methylobacterium planeticum]